MNIPNNAMALLITGIFLLTPSLCLSQNKERDSIIKSTETKPFTENTVKNLNLLSKKYYKSKPDSSLIFAHKAMSVSKAIDFKEGVLSARANTILATYRKNAFDEATTELKALMAQEDAGNYAQRSTLFALSEIYYKQEQLDSTLKYALATLKASEATASPNELLVYHNNLGIDYTRKGYLDRALHHSLSALRINEQLPYDPMRTFQLSINTANIYEYLKAPESSLSHRKKALKAAEDLQNSPLQAHAQLAVSTSFINLELLDEANRNLNEVERFMGAEKEQAAYLKTLFLTNMGILHKKLDNHKAAIENLEKALKNAQKDRNNMDILSVSNKLAETYLDLGNFQEAQKILEIASRTQETIDDLDAKKSTYLLKAKFDSLRGDIDSYVQNHWKFIKLKDSIASENTKKTIAQLNIVYETELKNKEIQLLTSERNVQEEKRKNMELVQTGLGALIMVLLLASIFWRRSYVQQKKSLSIIEKKNIENKLLIKEIHHRVKNNLQIISSLLSAQEGNFPCDDKLKKILSESQNRIKSLAIIHEELYQNNHVTNVNSRYYIERLIRNIDSSFSSSSKSIEVDTDIQDVQLKMNIAVPIGLIVNELMTNAYKYAFIEKQSGTIRIVYAKKEKTHKMVISDNGIGLKNDSPHTYSFGLQLVEGLSAQFKGYFKIKTDNGTQFEVLLNEPAD